LRYFDIENAIGNGPDEKGIPMEYTTAQAAMIKGVTRQTVVNQIKAGIVTAKVTVRGYRIKSEHLDEIIKRPAWRPRKEANDGD
jgi:hypothetical protein